MGRNNALATSFRNRLWKKSGARFGNQTAEASISSAAIPARYQRRTLLMAVLLMVLVIALRIWLQWNGSFPGDRFFAAVSRHRMPILLRAVFHAFNEFAQPAVAVVTVLFGMALLVRYVSTRAATGLGLASTVVIPVKVIKAVWGPTPFFQSITWDGGGTNYPSGHTAYATSVCGYLAILAWQRGRYEASVFLLLVLLGMGPTRVLSGVHIFSDVVAGYMIGVAWLIFATLCTEHGQPVYEDSERNSLNVAPAQSQDA